MFEGVTIIDACLATIVNRQLLCYGDVLLTAAGGRKRAAVCTASGCTRRHGLSRNAKQCIGCHATPCVQVFPMLHPRGACHQPVVIMFAMQPLGLTRSYTNTAPQDNAALHAHPRIYPSPFPALQIASPETGAPAQSGAQIRAQQAHNTDAFCTMGLTLLAHRQLAAVCCNSSNKASVHHCTVLGFNGQRRGPAAARTSQMRRTSPAGKFCRS